MRPGRPPGAGKRVQLQECSRFTPRARVAARNARHLRLLRRLLDIYHMPGSHFLHALHVSSLLLNIQVVSSGWPTFFVFISFFTTAVVLSFLDTLATVHTALDSPTCSQNQRF